MMCHTWEEKHLDEGLEMAASEQGFASDNRDVNRELQGGQSNGYDTSAAGP